MSDLLLVASATSFDRVFDDAGVDIERISVRAWTIFCHSSFQSGQSSIGRRKNDLCDMPGRQTDGAKERSVPY